MIVMSDGDPSSPAASLLKRCRKAKITVSTIAYGAHGGAQGPSVDLMKRIANVTGGKYYYLDDPRATKRQLPARDFALATPLRCRMAALAK